MLATTFFSRTGTLLGIWMTCIPTTLTALSSPPFTTVPQVAETETETKEQQSADGIPARTRKLRGSTSVDGYKIELVGIGEVEGTPGVTRFRPVRNQGEMAIQQPGNFNQNQFGQVQTFENGNGTGGAVGGFGNSAAGGGGFAIAGGNGSTAGGTFTLPNQGIALNVSEAKLKGQKSANQIVELGSLVKIIEQDGTVQQAEDMGPITHSWPEFEKQFPGSQCLFLNRKQPVSEPFKELSGQLHITPGRKLVAIFKGDRPQKKKIKGDEFSIQSVKSSPQSVQIAASFPLTSRIKKAKTLQDRMMAMMTSTDAYELEFEDSMGKIYVATGKSGSGAGGGSFQGFSFNGNTQIRSTQSPEPSLSTINFTFPPLSSNNTIKSITAVMRDVEGETQKVDFSIKVE